MVWDGDILDDTFEPYQEPTDKLIETKTRTYLTSTVGHACKNLFDMDKINQSQSGISNISMTQSTGSLSFTGTGVYKSISITDTELGVQRYGKTYTVSCINNLVSTTSGRITIRKQSTNVVVKSAWFNTTGTKSITFTPDEATFPDGWYISILATGSTSETGDVDISQLMLRESTILDDTFEPYQIPTDERVNNVQQTINDNNKYYPLLFSYAEENNTTTDITNISYRNNDFFINPSDGFIYSKKGFCAGPFTTAAAGKRVWVSQYGIYANNFLDDYSIKPYERMVIRAWAGKHTSNTGLLLTVDSGGLTMIGGGESSTNLANLIDNDQTTDSPKRLDINNSQGAADKETTAFTADSEQLILSSDNNIYFITNCQTLTERHGFSLDTTGTFYPMTNNFGSIGSSDYRWQYGYFGQVYGTGSSGMWRLARDKAAFLVDVAAATNSYAPALDLKTTSGDWSIGTLDSVEHLIFSYVNDTVYSGTENIARKYTLEAPNTPDSHTYNILHNGNTSFTQTLSSGTKIGSIEINGTSTDLYCETNTNTAQATGYEDVIDYSNFSFSKGTLPSLSTKSTTIYPVKSTTTTASKVVSKDITIYPVKSTTTTASKIVGKDTTFYPVTSSTTTATKTTLGTAIAADDITSWNAGTLPSFTVSKGILTLNSGTLPSLSYTARSIPNVTGNTNVTVPILSSPVTISEISTNTDITVPILSSSITIKEISTNTDVTVPILSSSVTISEVSTWSAGTLPSVSYSSVSVVTGVST